jgi:hypothetical protein
MPLSPLSPAMRERNLVDGPIWGFTSELVPYHGQEAYHNSSKHMHWSGTCIAGRSSAVNMSHKTHVLSQGPSIVLCVLCIEMFSKDRSTCVRPCITTCPVQ